jgi:hypothetical protein
MYSGVSLACVTRTTLVQNEPGEWVMLFILSEFGALAVRC